MKKLMALLLALTMCIVSVACDNSNGSSNTSGESSEKSKEVQSVENSISAIGEVSIDSHDKIKEVYDAYKALTESDKAAVSNYADFEKAYDEFFKIKYRDFADKLNAIAKDCDTMTSGIYGSWYDLGTSTFSTAFSSLTMIVNDAAVELLKEAAAKDGAVNSWKLVVVSAGWIIYPEGTPDMSGYLDLSIKEEDALVEIIIEKCIAFNETFYGISKSMEAVTEEIRIFKELYSDQYSDEIAHLNNWAIEANLYVSFMLDPSGTLTEYGSEKNEHNDAMERYATTAEFYY